MILLFDLTAASIRSTLSAPYWASQATLALNLRRALLRKMEAPYTSRGYKVRFLLY
jgi:hypothetical protein